MLPVFLCFCQLRLFGQIEIIPADDGICDEAVAALCNFLLFFFSLRIFSWIANSNCKTDENWKVSSL
jgi:hypothetical protein